MKGSVSQIKGFVNTRNSCEKKTITTTIAPFPPCSKITVINLIEKSELKNWYKMGKKGKHFRKTTPKHSSDEESQAEDEKLSRDLKNGRTGAAFIHPSLLLRRSPNRQRRSPRRSPNRQDFVPETPASQSPIVSSSADSTAVVEETPRLFWDPKARKMVRSHVPKLLANLGLKDIVPSINADDPIPSTSNQTPNVELLRDRTIQLPTHPEFTLFNLRKNFPNSPVFRRYTPERLRGSPPEIMRMSFREPSEESMENSLITNANEESTENLNEALEEETQSQFHQEAPIDTVPQIDAVLSESQILEQNTIDLDFNYDSFEFLNNASATREDDIALLDQLLEYMKYLSGVNVEFHEFFHGEDVLDENWPRGLNSIHKIETYEQCFSKIIDMDGNHIYNFPDPGIFQRLVYRGPGVPRIFERKRRVLSIRTPESPEVHEAPESPTPGPSNAIIPPEMPQPEVPQLEIAPAENSQNAENGYFSDDDAPDKSLMVRLALTSEVLSLQLDKVLGRQSPPGPYILDHERNTNYGINVRFNHIRASMKNRENEFPEINQPVGTRNDHTDQNDHTDRNDHTDQNDQEIQDDHTNQSGQTDQSISDRSIYERIDFSYPQEDLNDNIQIHYPETSVNNISEETGENYFTTSYPETSGASLAEETSGNYQADNETAGPGNSTSEFEYYRGEGEEIVSQTLANEGVNSFALLYDDGNAHFQGSAPNSSFDLSAIEPYGEEFNSNEAYDDNESEDVLDLELPFKFEHEFE